MSVPAIISNNAIPRYLDVIRKSGIPQKVDGKYLKTLGFKNSNDGALIPLFKSLGFLDRNGQPTDRYREYRAGSSEEAARILAAGIRACYSGLFAVYPDAYRKDEEALANWMRANSDKGEATQTRALKTFRTLSESASFDDAPSASGAAGGATESCGVCAAAGFARSASSPAAPAPAARPHPDFIQILLLIR